MYSFIFTDITLTPMYAFLFTDVYLDSDAHFSIHRFERFLERVSSRMPLSVEWDEDDLRTESHAAAGGALAFTRYSFTSQLYCGI